MGRSLKCTKTLLREDTFAPVEKSLIFSISLILLLPLTLLRRYLFSFLLCYNLFFNNTFIFMLVFFLLIISIFITITPNPYTRWVIFFC